MLLTANQEKALNHTHNLSVIANAGAGKTTVLIKRYLQILSTTDTQVKEIAAITFTEKAASELKKKIAEQIKEMLKEKSDGKYHRRWAMIRDQLTSANIGTIHSFCAQLLREYPVESGVDASFAVLNNFDQFAFEDESIRSAVTGMLTDMADPERRESILTLLRSIGRNRAETYCKAFLRKRELVDRIAEKFNYDSPGQVAEKTHAAMVRYAGEYLKNSGWEGLVDKMLNNSSGFPELRDELRKCNSSGDGGEVIELFYRIKDEIFTKKRVPTEKFLKSLTDSSAFEPEIARMKIILTDAEDIDGCRSENKTDRGNFLLMETLGHMFKLYREALARYEEKKAEYGCLDFEDILINTRSLLQNKEIAGAISAKFRYILVDEFQDTNSLQYDIIHSLALADNPLNLFIVGDAKQSIYGFRDAEVEVFNRADAEISSSSPDYSVVLGESFRLLPNLIDFVNRIFSGLMATDGADFSIKYDELVQGRDNQADGAVELLLVPDTVNDKAGGDEKLAAAAAECRMIAERILGLIRDMSVIYRGHGDVPGPFEFRDAAILLRGRTHLPTLEKTLREFKIPYIISGGIGYFQTQEVLDIVNYLKFLLNPDDDIALAGILRSPFFAASDADIFSIGFTGNTSLWEKLKASAGDPSSGRRFEAIADLMHEHLNIARRLTIPSLIRRIIVDTGWVGVMAGMPTGEQSIANIDKLIRIAREFEERGYPSLYDFVQRLSRYIAEEEREGQAAQDIQGNCVRIMTIHAAKGLEFSVVFLPFLHNKFRYDSAPYIDRDYGIAFSLIDEEKADGRIEPALLKFLRHRQIRRVEAEEKRILYVACTRARDMLILSGNKKSSRSKSFLKWIVESLGIGDRIDSDGVLLLDEAPVKILDRQKKSVVCFPHKLVVTVRRQLREGRGGEWNMKTKSAGLEPKEYHLAPVGGSVSGEFYSATQIAAYLECPMKFYLKYHLGVPEYSPRPCRFSEEEDSNDKLMGDVEGTLTHSVLQSVGGPDMPEKAVTAEIRSIMMRSPSVLMEQWEKYEENIKQTIMGFLHSRIGKVVLAPEESRSEFKINLALENYFFTGTMDRLFRDSGGLWNIVDYKTNRIDIDEIEELAERYLPQMKFYAVLVKRYFGQAQVPVNLIFLRHPEKPYSFILNEKQIEDFEKVMLDVGQKIARKQFDQNSVHCPACGYQESGQCVI